MTCRVCDTPVLLPNLMANPNGWKATQNGYCSNACEDAAELFGLEHARYLSHLADIANRIKEPADY